MQGRPNRNNLANRKYSSRSTRRESRAAEEERDLISGQSVFRSQIYRTGSFPAGNPAFANAGIKTLKAGIIAKFLREITESVITEDEWWNTETKLTINQGSAFGGGVFVVWGRHAGVNLLIRNTTDLPLNGD